jgi:hypothetical protein
MKTFQHKNNKFALKFIQKQEAKRRKTGTKVAMTQYKASEATA